MFTADSYESNNTRQTATTIANFTTKGTMNMTIHSTTDEDWVKFYIPKSGLQDNYIALQNITGGNLYLRLYNSNGNLIQTSYSTTSTSKISLSNLSSGYYYARVSGQNRATSSYQFAYNLLQSDAYEGTAGNNTFAKALQIVPTTQSGSISNLTITTGDVDFYKITLSAAGTTSNYIGIDQSDDCGNLDIALYNTSGNLVRSISTSSIQERMNLYGVAAGTYYVKVYGKNGATGTYSLVYNFANANTITADQYESNNTMAAASDFTTRTHGGTISDLTIHSTTDVDFYKFKLSTAGTSSNYIGIDLLNDSGNLDIELYNSAGTKVKYSSGTSTKERMYLSGLAAGTYYLKVYGKNRATGKYSIAYNIPAAAAIAADQYESNNTMTTAKDFTEKSGNGTISDLTIHSSTDVDFYKFKLSKTGTSSNYIAVNLLNGCGDLDIVLLNSSGSQIKSSSTTSTQEKINLNGLTAGTYYLKVLGYRGATGKYSIAYNIPEAIAADQYESNNTMATAKDFTEKTGTGTVSNLTIHNTTDVDFYKFKLTKTGTSSNYIGIDLLSGSGNLDVELYNSAGTRVKYSNGTSTTQERMYLNGLAAGTYYLKVYGKSGATGKYSIAYNIPAASVITADQYESNDSMTTAKDFTEKSGNGTISDLTIHSTTDVDFYKFKLSNTGTSSNYIGVNLLNGCGDLDIILLNSSGSPIKSSATTSTQEKINLNGLTAGTYYLKVYGYRGATGKYSIAYNIPVSSAIAADQHESNNTKGTATDFTGKSGSGTVSNLTIHSSTDVDFYKFNLSKTGTSSNYIGIDLLSGSGNLDVELYNSAGTRVKYSNGTSTTQERMYLNGLAAGTYYLKVYGRSGATGKYSIAYNIPEAIAADQYESNDSMTAAVDFTARVTSGTFGCMNIHDTTDVDFYKFRLSSTGTASNYIEINLGDNCGDLDVELYNSAGTKVRYSNGTSTQERMYLTGLAAGIYYLKVYGNSGATGKYSISYNVCPPPAINADQYENNNSIQSANDFTAKTGSGTVSNLTIHNAADVDFYKFKLSTEASSNNYIGISQENGSGDLDIGLYNSSGSLIRISRGTSNSEKINLSGLATGTYYLKVYGKNNATGKYSLNYNIPSLVADKYESNDTRTTAKDFIVRTGAGVVNNLSIHNTTDVDFYKFNLATGSTSCNYIGIDQGDNCGDLDIELYNSSGTKIKYSCTTSSSERINLGSLAAGTYYLKVYGKNGAKGNYSIVYNVPEAQVYSADKYEPNNTMDKAKDFSALTGMHTISDLTIHNTTDVDFYKFNLISTGTDSNYIRIHEIEPYGDLDIELYNSSGNRVRYSTTSRIQEEINLSGLAAGTYYLKVFGNNGSTGKYSLDYYVPEVPAIKADRYETNDLLRNAVDFTNLTATGNISDLTIHSTTDVDFYKFNLLTAGTESNYIGIKLQDGSGDLNIALFNSSGTQIKSSNSTSSNREIINLAALSAGTYYLKVYGNNGNKGYYSIDYRLPVVSADKYETNDTRATATDLTKLTGAGTVSDLNIHTITDVDYYKITLSTTGTANNYIGIDKLNLDIALYSTSGIQVRNTTTTSTMKKVDLKGLAAGTYYLQVRGYNNATGSYSIKYNIPEAAISSDRYESNDSMAAATNIARDSYQGQMDMTIHSITDQDWIKFYLSTKGTSENYIAMQNITGGDLDLQLYDSTGKILRSSATDSTTERLSLQGLNAGYYYARAYGYNHATGSYTFAYNLTPPIMDDAYEGTSGNNTLAKASKLTFNTAKGTVSDLTITSGDVDFYKFTLPSTGTATNYYIGIDLNNAKGNLDIALYNSSGTQIKSTCTTSNQEKINLGLLNAGTYYLKVYGRNNATGDYSIIYNVPASSVITADRYESNNTIATARDFTNLTGKGSVSDLTIHNTTDVDYYKVKLTSMGTASNSIQINFTRSEGELKVGLYDSNGTCVRTPYSLSNAEFINLQALNKGTYYLKVYGTGGATGKYSISYSLSETLTADIYEGTNGNNTIQTASTAFVSGGSGSAAISSNSDIDYYKVTLASKGTSTDKVKISFTHSLGDLDLYLHNSSGSYLKSSSGTSSTEEISLNGYSAGTYYIRVKGYNGATGQYNIAVTLSGKSAAAGISSLSGTDSSESDPAIPGAVDTDLAAWNGNSGNGMSLNGCDEDIQLACVESSSMEQAFSSETLLTCNNEAGTSGALDINDDLSRLATGSDMNNFQAIIA